jgi:hypothetical protein
MRWVSQGLNPSYRPSLLPDQIRHFLPWLHRPVARCGAGWRGQHEDRREVFLCRLPAQCNRFGWPVIEKTRGFLAGERDGLRPIAPHLFPEACNVDGEGEGLMVHSRAELANIGEADADVQQRLIFMRLVAARRDADLMDRAPEAIARTRVVMAGVGRPLAGGGADEDEAQVRLKLVGKPIQLVRALVETYREG